MSSLNSKPNEFVVQTATASMPGNCWGIYRRVAVLEVEPGTIPTMISTHARGVLHVIKTWERLNVGPIARAGGRGKCAYSRALDEAEELADELNAAADLAPEKKHHA